MELLERIADNVAVEIGGKVLEGHRLHNWLRMAGVPEAREVTNYIMEEWSEDEGVYSYEIGIHDTIWIYGHEITKDVRWKFESLSSDSVVYYSDLMDGLLTTKRLMEQGL